MIDLSQCGGAGIAITILVDGCVARKADSVTLRCSLGALTATGFTDGLQVTTGIVTDVRCAVIEAGTEDNCVCPPEGGKIIITLSRNGTNR